MIILLNKFNGNFAIIIKFDDKVFLASDIIRSIPLLYHNSGNNYIITDDIIKYNDKTHNLLLSEEFLTEFIHSGFVYGNNTVFKDVHCIQAGEVACISLEGLNTERYFRYLENKYAESIDNIESFADSLDHVLNRVFLRMIKSFDKVNNWVIPLSGGHDSRLIVNYLRKLDQKNVICFSYGYPDNEQSKISKKVAETLGYKFYFIEYTGDLWHNLHTEGMIEDFLPNGFNGVSSPHLQDFLAIYTLKKNKIIGNYDVIVPGHALDFIAGSHLEGNSGNYSMDVVFNKLIKKHANYFNDRIKKEAVYDRMEECLKILDVDLSDFAECFNWQERQSKFIVNSVRSYEYFGFEWILPFWDRELVEFWLKIRKECKTGRSGYFNAEDKGILLENLLTIPFASEKAKRKKTIKLFSMVKTLIPPQIKTMIVRLLKQETRMNEGLNFIFSLEGNSVEDLIAPLSFYPNSLRKILKNYLNRYPFQVNVQGIVSLFCIKKVLAIKGYRFSND